MATRSSDPTDSSLIQIAHIGNSIQYYNDCPRLLQWMFKTHYGNANQDSCLRGGASLVSILRKGNGMAGKFASPNALRPDGTYDIGSPTVMDLLGSKAWDFVIMNDHTQSPARMDTRKEALKELEKSYLPMLEKMNKMPLVVFLMTAAYRKPVKDSEDLGSFDDFTELLRSGYAEYQKVIPNSVVAPVGLAYLEVRKKYPKLDGDNDSKFSWEWLYARDDFHPSPHGTLLEAFVLFATIVGQEPPEYNPAWWDTARYMQPADEEALPLPSLEEGALLRDFACLICKVGRNDTRVGESEGAEEQSSRL